MWPPVDLIGVSVTVELCRLVTRAVVTDTGCFNGRQGDRPLLKLEWYNGSESLDTFLMRFRRMANYSGPDLAGGRPGAQPGA